MPRYIEVDEVVSGTPDEVAARLKSQTRFSLFAHTAKGGLWGNTPLKGRVSARGATVSLRRFDRWGRIQPVYQARFEPHARGTRVRGYVGIPPMVLWGMRLSVLMSCIAAVIMASQITQGVADSMLGWFVWIAIFGAITVGSIGTQMNFADARLESLAQTVTGILGTQTTTASDALSDESTGAGAAAADAHRDAEDPRRIPPMQDTTRR